MAMPLPHMLLQAFGRGVGLEHAAKDASAAVALYIDLDGPSAWGRCDTT